MNMAAHPFLAAPPFLYVERPVEYEDIIAKLLDRTQSGPVGITTGLRGAGGFGKTTLAQAVCQDPRIKKAYPEGTLWVELGETATKETVIERIQYLVGRLTGDLTPLPDLTTGRMRLYEALEGRRVLLVIDNVWDGELLTPFLQGGADCGRLVTTRLDETLPRGTRKVNVDEMRTQEALRLITSGVTAEKRHSIENRALEDRLGRLTEMLGNWPLLLEQAGVQLANLLEEKNSLELALTEMEADYEELGLTAFDNKQKAHKVLGISVEGLEEKQKARFLELAVFPKDIDIPLGALEALWGFTSRLNAEERGRETEKLCAALSRKSLLKQFDPVGRKIRLHDVVQKYLAERQEDKIAGLHEALLEGYGMLCPRPGEWGKGPKDGYFFRWLVYHLAAAGQIDELKQLLLNYDWMDAHLRNGGIGELLSDYEVGLRIVKEDQEVIRLVQRVLLMSSPVLWTDIDQLAGQLLGRMRGFEQPAIQTILTKASQRREYTRLQPVHRCLNNPGDPEILTLRGHMEAINCAAISPDGRLAVTGSDDNTLKVWDLTSGHERHALEGHTDPVSCVAISPDGRMAVSGSLDNTLKVWDLAAAPIEGRRRELHSMEGHSDYINCVAISPDSQLTVSGSDDGTLRVWALASGEELYTLEGHTDAIHTVAISRDGQLVISGSNDATVRVWNLANGKELYALKGHNGIISDVMIRADGRLAVSASNDNTLKVWDLETGHELGTLVGHTGPVDVAAISPDGRLVVSGSRDRTLMVWNLEQDTPTGQVLEGHTGIVTSLAISPDGKYIISGSEDRTLKIWKLAPDTHPGTKTALNTLKSHSRPIRVVAISQAGDLAISAAGDGTLMVWDLVQAALAGQETKAGDTRVEGHAALVNSVAISKDGKMAVSGSNDHTLRVWNLDAAEKAVPFGANVCTLQGHLGGVKCVAISPDGQLAVSGSNDCTLRIWSLANGKELHTLKGHSSYVHCVAISPDGLLAVSGSGFQDPTIMVWRLADGEVLHTLKGHTSSIQTIAISPNSRLAVSGSSDYTLKVWDLTNGIELHTLAGHSSYINEVVISPDGKLAVSGSNDCTLKVWDLANGVEQATLKGHTDPVQTIAIVDGRMAVSGSSDNTLKVWDLHRGVVIHTLRGHSSHITCVATSQDGRLAVSGSFDKTVKVWDLVNGECQATLCVTESVSTLAVSPSEHVIIAGDYGGKIYILQMVGF